MGENSRLLRNIPTEPRIGHSKLLKLVLLTAVATCALSSCIVLPAQAPKNEAIQTEPVIMAAGDVICDPKSATLFNCNDVATAAVIERQNPTNVMTQRVIVTPMYMMPLGARFRI